MWEATGSHEEQCSLKNNVIKGLVRTLLCWQLALAAGPTEGWRQHSQRGTAAASRMGADSLLQDLPAHSHELLQGPLQEA